LHRDRRNSVYSGLNVRLGLLHCARNDMSELNATRWGRHTSLDWSGVFGLVASYGKPVIHNSRGGLNLPYYLRNN